MGVMQGISTAKCERIFTGRVSAIVLAVMTLLLRSNVAWARLRGGIHRQ